MYTLPGIFVGDLIWLSNDYDNWGSTLDISLTLAGNTLSMAMNAVTTMMIAYKFWYVPAGGIRWIQWLTMNCCRRIYRTFIVKTLGLSRRRSPVQTVLILLVESGLVYLGFQVSHFDILDPQSSHRSGR